MLIVKFNNGSELEDRTYNVCDITDFRLMMNTLLDEFQKVLEQNRSEERIELERVLDASDYDNADDLIEWIERMQEIESDLNNSDFDDVEEMKDRIETLESAIDNIFHEADDVRRW